MSRQGAKFFAVSEQIQQALRSQLLNHSHALWIEASKVASTHQLITPVMKQRIGTKQKE